MFGSSVVSSKKLTYCICFVRNMMVKLKFHRYFQTVAHSYKSTYTTRKNYTIHIRTATNVKQFSHHSCNQQIETQHGGDSLMKIVTSKSPNSPSFL